MRRTLSIILSVLIMVPMSLSASVSVNAMSSEKIENSVAGEVSTDYSDYHKSTQSFSNATTSIALESNSAAVSHSGTAADGGIKLENSGQYVEWSFEVPSDAIYLPSIAYTAIQYNDSPIGMSLQIDGEFPFSQAESFELNRLWVNSSIESSFDKDGNEFAPEQTEAFEKQYSGINDINGFVTDEMCVSLKKGKHTIKLTLKEGKVEIHSLSLNIPYSAPKYDNLKKEYENNGYKSASAKELVLEGEAATSKSSKFLSSLSCRSNVAVLPSDPFVERVNYIGGGNWKAVGDTINWEVDVKEDGLYKLGFHYHQTYLQEGVSYRKLLVDGKVPFEEAEAIPFKYSDWDFYTFADEVKNPYEIYLTKGKHTISLSVTLGNLADFSLKLRNLVDEIGKIYRSIVMITGETPDANRDYNLFTSIPSLEEDLKRINKTLDNLADESEKIIGSEGGSSAQILRKATLTIEQMLKKKYKAQTKLGAYYDNYASLSSWLYEMQNMALDIDAIVLTGSENEFVREKAGFFETAKYEIMRIIASFIVDYKSKSSTSKETEITLWSNWGRDQLRVLSSLITNDFTPKYNINVNLKITDASIIQANLSGNNPDVEIMLARTQPVNYAMRGTLYDLSKFNDFEEVTKRFGDTAMIPYEYKGGFYGLPDTQAFSVMFIRTDVFEELNLKIPKTWNEFILTSKVLALNNMEVAVGEGSTFFMSQKGISLYSEDRLSTNLTSPEAIEALTFWTDLYTKYNLPVTYDFFNRFRTGLIPMGIQPYSLYATLKAAAPEINGHWVIAEVPGFEDENGNINNSALGTGTAASILNASKNKEASWEFLKWWTSEDIQYRFSNGVEAVLGVTGRTATSNKNALLRLGWDNDTVEVLSRQMKKVNEIPEVPGSYYVARSLQQIFWNVVNNNEDLEEMTQKWALEANDEIYRKTQEYQKDIQ